MAKFEVLAKVIVPVEAGNIEEANKIVAESLPQAEIEYFYNEETEGMYYVVGKCEISGLSILEGDDYVYDEDGVTWLKKFDPGTKTEDNDDSLGLLNITETF